MTSAFITPDTKDTPSLTVTISKLSSSSPFPSPGSPFLPPPIPSAHEYALVSPLSKRRSTDSRMNVGSKIDHESAAASHPVGVATIPANAGKSSSTLTGPQPTLEKRRASAEFSGNGSNNGNGLVASFSEFGKPDSKPTTNGQGTAISTAKLPKIASEPPPEDTLNSHSNTQSPSDDDASGTSASPPTPLSTYQDPSTADDCITTTPSPFITTTATEDTTKPSQDSRKSLRRSLRSSRGSLSSSRPAPPSPADSRRASTALSRQSSTRSHPGSISPLIPANNTDLGTASPTTPTPTQLQQQSQHQAVRAASASAAASPSILVKIRDFAFPDEDVRHTGTGPLTPRPNRRLQRPLSTWSASSASSAGSEDQDEGAGGSSYVFSNWGLGRLSWFGMRGTDNSAASSVGDGPSQGDFARNFTDAESPDYEIDDPYESLDDDDDDNDGDRVSADGENREHPLLPGLYRALYAFEPEGTAEMALEEDQIVRVIGRGGGVGWAIVARGGDDGHALVPEGYLELVSLDRDQVGEEEG